MADDFVFITPSASIVDALKQLDRSAKKVLLVVDANRRLLGTLTDGDIRRYILRTGSLDGSVADAYNAHPVVLRQEEAHVDRARTLFMERQLEMIPVVDPQGVVVDYFLWKDVFHEEETVLQQFAKIDIPVVIMAGGKGTRLLPLTVYRPKPMIPFFNYRYGIRQFYLTVNYKAEMIKAYFNGLSVPYEVHFVQEERYLGTAGSLALLKDQMREPFFVANCDVLLDVDFAEVYHFHQDHQAHLTSVVAIQHYQIPYGVVTMLDGGQIEKITEKPEYTLPINTGVYLLSPEVLRYIPEGKPFDMPQLMQRLMEQRHPIYAYPIPSGAYIDVGQWAEYRQAVEKLRL